MYLLVLVYIVFFVNAFLLLFILLQRGFMTGQIEDEQQMHDQLKDTPHS